MNGEWHDLKPGDVVFVPPDVEHEYANAGDGDLQVPVRDSGDEAAEGQ